MSTAKAHTAHLIGLSAEIVTVEVDISNGLNAVSIVGLGDRAVEEAKDRVSAAIKNSNYVSPKQKNQKVVISLAPADSRKEGPSFDLAMAVAYLAASGNTPPIPENALFFGELSLEGGVRQVSGLLPILCQAAAMGFRSAYVPFANLDEASMAPDITAYGISALTELLDGLSGTRPLQPAEKRDEDSWMSPAVRSAKTTDNDRQRKSAASRPDQSLTVDMSFIRGNETAKRGLEIAAAGGHNILMYGPPGTGKTMLAQSLPSILPPLSREQAIEVTGIHSAARILKSGLVTEPPFRAPHHTASYPAIVGGGSFPQPGEITLAHRGVLFMDEFPEFDREVLEALRQPLEDHFITISRAKGSVTFPAQFILVASMNPCPCGKTPETDCSCRPHELRAYRKRLSGPIMDRIDISVSVDMVDYDKLSALDCAAESSSAVRSRVAKARAVQARRFAAHGLKKNCNSELTAGDIGRLAAMEPEARSYLASSGKRLGLSGRAFHRVIKVARTIADLANDQTVNRSRVMEALQYRQRVFDDI